MAQYKIQPRVLENEAGEAKSAEHGCHCADLLASLEVLVILVERDHGDQQLDRLRDLRCARRRSCGH